MVLYDVYPPACHYPPRSSRDGRTTARSGTTGHAGTTGCRRDPWPEVAVGSMNCPAIQTDPLPEIGSADGACAVAPDGSDPSPQP